MSSSSRRDLCHLFLLADIINSMFKTSTSHKHSRCSSNYHLLRWGLAEVEATLDPEWLQQQEMRELVLRWLHIVYHHLLTTEVIELQCMDLTANIAGILLQELLRIVDYTAVM